MRFDATADRQVFSRLLRTCSSLGDLEMGLKVHAEISRNDVFTKDTSVAACVVDMYAKCGALEKAKDVLKNLPVRNVVSWTALIAGYVQCGCCQDALSCLPQMLKEGIPPNAVTLVCCLKGIDDISQGEVLHAHAIKLGFFDVNVFVGSTLVDMYSKCGCLLEAQSVFSKLLFRNVVSWTALMVGFIEHGYADEALCHFEKMQGERISPNVVTFTCSLKACCHLSAVDKGREIHAEIVRNGFDNELSIFNSLIDMYAKCGHFTDAKAIFVNLRTRDAASWTVLIARFVRYQCCDEALHYFEQMQKSGAYVNAVTSVCCLQACNCIVGGRLMHSGIIKRGFDKDFLLGSGLIHMYAKCGSLYEAHYVFSNLSYQNVFSWTALITGCGDHGHVREALHHSGQMESSGISRNTVTLTSSLKCCESKEYLGVCHELHTEIIMKGFERELSVGNTMVNVYSKLGCFKEAQVIFGKIINRSVVTWNALIAGYVEHGLNEEVLKCCEAMYFTGIVYDAITIVCSIKACGNIYAMEEGQGLHIETVKQGLDVDLLVGNSLIYMYAKVGLLTEAHKVFVELPFKDVISWTVLLTGYTEHGLDMEALLCFQQMSNEGICMNPCTIICLLRSCSNISIMVTGEKIHRAIVGRGLEHELLIGNNLIIMYANCGSLPEAKDVFERLPKRDIASWNALMAAYSVSGEIEEAFLLLDEMMGEDIQPNLVSHLTALNACNHGGLVDEGLVYFNVISNEPCLIPAIQHFACVVDLLSRAGQVSFAVVVMNRMPFQPNIMMGHILLGACLKWRNVQIGKHAFDFSLMLDENDVLAYLWVNHPNRLSRHTIQNTVNQEAGKRSSCSHARPLAVKVDVPINDVRDITRSRYSAETRAKRKSISSKIFAELRGKLETKL